MTWQLTATGATFDLCRADPASISLLDIAQSLATTNRYNGAALRPNSVAEHSLLVVEIMQRDLAISDAATLLAGRKSLSAKALATLPLLQQSTRPDSWQAWFTAQGVEAPLALSGPRYEQFSMTAAAPPRGLGAHLAHLFVGQACFLVAFADAVAEMVTPHGNRSRMCSPDFVIPHLLHPALRKQNPGFVDLTFARLT